jgi:hypothetical protein
MSLAEAEALTGINRGTLSIIERGTGPRWDHARRLIDAYLAMAERVGAGVGAVR